MCVISISLRGKKFPEADLRRMWDANPHGAGIAFLRSDGRVEVKKGFMSFDQFMEVYETVPEAMHALHFRLRSAGEILPQLTHPFRVDGIDTQKLKYNAKAVLFHNGTVSDWRTLYIAILSSFTKKERDKILSLQCVSDTYVVSLLVNRFGHNILRHLDGGKWLLFEKEPVFYGHWYDGRDGFKYSNLTWKSVHSIYSNAWRGIGGYGGWYKRDDDGV